MGVAVQTPLGVAVRSLVAGEVPDDQGLVSGAGQEHVGAVGLSVTAHCGRRASGLLVPCKLSSLQTHATPAILGTYFSSEVAREVTQPVWPSRVPRRTNCSAMMCVEWLDLGMD